MRKGVEVRLISLTVIIFVSDGSIFRHFSVRALSLISLFSSSMAEVEGALGIRSARKEIYTFASISNPKSSFGGVLIML